MTLSTMRHRRPMFARTAVVLAGALLLGGLAATTSALAATTPAPAITSDPNAANGNIVFHNATGAVITSGSNLKHLFDYAEATTNGRTGATRGTAYFAFPDHTQPDSQTWNQQQATASTLYPNSAYPAPLNSSKHPIAKAVSADADLKGLLATTTLDTTAGYDGIVQVRLFDSGPGVAQQTVFWASDIFFDSTAGTWKQVFPAPVATAPGAPTIATATAGSGQATISFTAPTSDGDSAITSYTVTSSPDGVTQSGSGSPITVTGLVNGTPYTFTVTATNAAGTSVPSAASNAVKPAAPTVPGAPTDVVASSGNGSAGVTFVAPASTGGTPITQYRVSASDGISPAVTTTTVGTSITLTGLTNGTVYQVTVVAINAQGDGPASTPASVTPAPTVPGAPTGVTAIARSGGATVSFTPPAGNGGSTITTYTVTASTGQTAFGSASPIVVVVPNGIFRRFQVTATNAVGTGPASALSNSVVYKVTTRVTASVTSTVNSGGRATLHGVLSGGPIASQPLVATLVTVGHGTRTLALRTTSTGTYVTVFTATYSTKVTVRFAGTTTSTSASSPVVAVAARTVVTITSPRTGTSTRIRTIAITGTTSPHKGGQYVTLYERRSTSYVKLAVVKVSSTGTFRFVRTFSKATHVIQVRIAAVTGNAAGNSALVTFKEI